MADANVEQIVVTVDDQHLSTIQNVATALRSAGMNVLNVMATAGIITGEVSRADMNALKTVPGVLAVERDEEMRAI